MNMKRMTKTDSGATDILDLQFAAGRRAAAWDNDDRRLDALYQECGVVLHLHHRILLLGRQGCLQGSGVVVHYGS